MKTAIFVDSASDIDEQYANKRDIFLIKFHAMIDGRDFVLNQNITREEYISLVKSSKDFPKTSVPTLNEVKKTVFDVISKGFDRFIFITSSQKISGIYNLCKTLIESDNLLSSKSLLFDSGSTSAELGIQALLLSKQDFNSWSFDQINHFLLKVKKNLKFYYVVYDLSYLVRGGRLKPVQGLFGKLLNVYPIGSQENGVPVVVDKAVGLRNVYLKLKKHIKNFVLDSSFTYGLLSGSVESESLANNLNQQIFAYFGSKSNFLYHFKTNLVPTSHFGPDVFGIVVHKDE
ncbi:MAG: fatty acid kinase fatty acid binding subunit [Candidatus Woesearchaeota archaeon]|nr:fatty acid kinase fatty acid binding subunit [Candidatus Woesearchaeota archaeon]